MSIRRIDKSVTAKGIQKQLELIAEQGGTHAHENKSVIDKLADSNGILLYNGSPIHGSSGEGFLSFNTLAELQAAYPNGTNKPAWVSTGTEKGWYYWDGTVTETPSDTTPPNNVTNLTATPSQTSVQLGWTASTSSDVSGYEILRGSTLLTTITGTSYNATGLTEETLYNFTVKAKDSNGNISSGVSVSTTTLSSEVEQPTDTTPPVLTITPATTFTTSQTVNMSTNETATIWYTLDDSDPTISGTKIQYISPLTLTETDTVKAYAVDTAGNSSAVQSVTYTKETAIVGESMLYLDGTGDYIQLPDLTFDEIMIEFVSNRGSYNGTEYLFDARVGSTAYLYKTTTSGNISSTVLSTTSLNGRPIAKYSSIPSNKRNILLSKLSAQITDNLTVFAKNDGTEAMQGYLFKIKVFNSGVLQASYDFTSQFNGNVVQDLSGNGHDATLFGGTWMSNTYLPPTPTATNYAILLDGVDDLIAIPTRDGVKHIELEVSRENNDSTGYLLDGRPLNTLYVTSGANAGYTGFTVDGASKTVGNSNVSDIPNATKATVLITLTTNTKYGSITLGTKNESSTISSGDWLNMKVYGVKLLDSSMNILDDFDFTQGQGNDLYSTSGVTGTIVGGTWLAL